MCSGHILQGLKYHDTCHITRVVYQYNSDILQICRRYDVSEATAFLLEKLGAIQEAFDVLLEVSKVHINVLLHVTKVHIRSLLLHLRSF